MSTEASTNKLEAAQEKLKTPIGRWTSGLAKIFRREQLVVILLVVLAASAYFKHEEYAKSAGWGIFHYYLGAKYFSEIGNFNLYTCALEADDEAAGYWHWIVGARDMETYRIVRRSSLPPCPRRNFTTERWSEFSQDIEYFAFYGRSEFFASVFIDKGFNPPPSWVAVAKPLAQAVPISKSWATDIVFNLDIIAVLIVGVLIIWRSSDWIAAFLTAGLAIFYFGNSGGIGWNFLQYFWFPLLVVAVHLWAKNSPGLSGAALGAAVGLQTFPLFFGLPIVVRGITEFLRHRNKAEWRPYFRFSGALLAVMLASFLLGSLAGRGVGGWAEWQRKISIHRNYLRGEIFNIGLANLTAATVSRNHSNGTSYVDDTPNTFMRLDSLKSNIWIYYALCAILLSMWVLIVVCAPAGDLFGHGVLIMYTAVSLSPYYYLSLALVPFMFWKSNRILRLYTTWGTVALFAAHAILFRHLYASFVSCIAQWVEHSRGCRREASGLRWFSDERGKCPPRGHFLWWRVQRFPKQLARPAFGCLHAVPMLPQDRPEQESRANESLQQPTQDARERLAAATLRIRIRLARTELGETGIITEPNNLEYLQEQYTALSTRLEQRKLLKQSEGLGSIPTCNDRSVA